MKACFKNDMSEGAFVSYYKNGQLLRKNNWKGVGCLE